LFALQSERLELRRHFHSTSDWRMREEDGCCLILGCTDDVINVARHRLGTREIDESMSSRQNRAEVAVVTALIH
jgi:propionyl-CoA synthetase